MTLTREALDEMRDEAVLKELRRLNRIDDRHTEEGLELGFDACKKILWPRCVGLSDDCHKIIDYDLDKNAFINEKWEKQYVETEVVKKLEQTLEEHGVEDAKGD